MIFTLNFKFWEFLVSYNMDLENPEFKKYFWVLVTNKYTCKLTRLYIVRSFNKMSKQTAGLKMWPYYLRTSSCYHKVNDNYPTLSSRI